MRVYIKKRFEAKKQNEEEVNQQPDSSAQKAQFDKEVQALKNQKDMPDLVNTLNNLTPDQLDLLELGFGNGTFADKMKWTEEAIPAKDLHPTQNEIDVGKSLSYQVNPADPEQQKKILANGPVTINLPLVVYDYNGTHYIVDGHHRWSQVFLLNPNCKINSVVFKNSAGDNPQDPADMLRDFQGAIAVANGGKVPSSKVEPGMNIFDWVKDDDDKLKDYLDKNITDKMVDVYQDYYNAPVSKNAVRNSILGNASIMATANTPIRNAPSRAVMPQTDTGHNAGLNVAKQGMTDI